MGFDTIEINLVNIILAFGVLIMCFLTFPLSSSNLSELCKWKHNFLKHFFHLEVYQDTYLGEKLQFFNRYCLEYYFGPWTGVAWGRSYLNILVTLINFLVRLNKELFTLFSLLLVINSSSKMSDPKQRKVWLTRNLSVPPGYG